MLQKGLVVKIIIKEKQTVYRPMASIETLISYLVHKIRFWSSLLQVRSKLKYLKAKYVDKYLGA